MISLKYYKFDILVSSNKMFVKYCVMTQYVTYFHVSRNNTIKRDNSKVEMNLNESDCI